MSTELQVLESREIVITDEQTELIKKTICADATDAEMRLFFYDCQRRGVHPLDKLIHFTKRGKVGQKKYTPITSIDFMRQRAQASKVFMGEDEPLYALGSDGLPDSCKYVVYRLVQGERCKWTATARWDEYYPGDDVGFLWKKMPFVMLTKCAEALALRKAFPAELQGLYVKEEMDQAGAERRPLPTGSEMLAKLENNPPIDAAATRGGKTSQEAWLANETVKSGGQAKSSVHEPAVEEVMEDLRNQEPFSNPAEPYLAKVRTAHDEKEARAAYEAIPDELKQDVHQWYFDKLKELGARKKK